MTAASVMSARRDPGAAYRELLVGGARRPRTWMPIVSDTLTAALAVFVATLWHFGGEDAGRLRGAPSLLAVMAVVPVWPLGLWACGAYGRRLLADDTQLPSRILRTAARMTVLLAVAAVLIDSTALLRHDLLAVILAASLTPVTRRLDRWVDERMSGGPRRSRRVLIVGHAGSIAEFLLHQRPADARRLSIVAACVVGPRDPAEEADLPVPVVGGLDGIVRAAVAHRCDVVIALGCPEFGRGTLRRLCWRLHTAGVEVALAPILTDVAAGRLALATAGGLPLLHLRAPVLAGPVRRLADVCQRVVALTVLVLISPLMLTLAVLVRATSRGPALFRQTRVGLDGAEFTCLKFRTMVVDAEARQAEIAHLNEMRDGPLFKISKDPRLTRIGAALRRYSLDELPQLLNVLGGSMALVGPRPPLPAEVARYSEDMRRRLAVKPGLTGLWQVSGRSSLSWAESVRLDLSYVENWSPGLDAMILLRTTSAVVRGEGAY